MQLNENYDDLLNEAKAMYASGYDNTYIEFQFADKGIDDRMIDKIVEDIEEIRRWNRKRKGIKSIILGSCFIAAAILITLFTSYLPVSMVYATRMAYAMCFLAVSGVVLLIKGVMDSIGL